MIRIYGEQYEVNKFIEENLPCRCWRYSCKDHNSCVQCLANAYGLEIKYDEIKNS